MNKKQKNFFLSGSDGGTVFTMAVMTLLITSIAFSFLMQAFNIKGDLSTYLGYFCSSLALAIVLFYALFVKGLHFSQGVAFKKFDKKYILIALLLSVGSLFALSWINEAFIALMSKLFNYVGNPIQLPKNGFGDFLLCTLFICALPAFFEEIVFRGVILNGCKRLGDLFAVVVSGILFSLFHTNPMQTVYQFIMGAIFCLLTIKSGSIIPAILMHFINNFYIVIFYFLTPIDYALPATVNAVLTVIGVISLVLGLIWLIRWCDKPVCDQKLNAEYQNIVEIKEERKGFLIFSVMGILCCIVLWVSNFITYVN